MPKMSKFEVAARLVWSLLETLRKTAAMRQEEQGKYNQWRGSRLVYVLLLCTNRGGYLPLGVLLSAQSNWVRSGNKTCKLRQGLVTSKSPIEALQLRLRFLISKKMCLIAWLSLLKLLITRFFYGSKVRLQLCILGPLLQFGGDLDRLSKRALIALFPVVNTSTQITQVATPLERVWFSLVPSRQVCEQLHGHETRSGLQD